MPNDHPVVYILGAGVDKSLGMPLANELLSDVAAFANGPGKPVADALRTHLPHLRFSFSKYTGEQGETFAERVLVEDSQALSTAKSVLDRYVEEHSDGETDRIRAVRTVVDALAEIRDTNRLEDGTLNQLAKVGGEAHQPSGGDFIFNPRGIALTPVVRQAFRKTFQGLMQDEELTKDERETLTEMALAMMNVEELLGDLFSGFYTGQKTRQKQYLYVAWLCWAYLRLKMEESLGNGQNSLYQHLASLSGGDRVITLNYTSKFFSDATRPAVHSFHGDCLSYIRLDTRQLIKDDQRVLEATTVEAIADFVRSLDIDLDSDKVFLPGIVPPLSVKPVMCREHLETWYECGQIIDDASTIVIVGYSFNLADEHLNDLLRKRRGATDVRIVIVNPDMDGTSANVCNILGLAADQLTDTIRAGLNCRQAGNLVFANARSEQLTSQSLEELLRQARW